MLKEEPEARRDLLTILKYFKGSAEPDLHTDFSRGRSGSAEKIFCGSGHSGSNSQNRNQLKFQGKRVHLQEYQGGRTEGILGD